MAGKRPILAVLGGAFCVALAGGAYFALSGGDGPAAPGNPAAPGIPPESEPFVHGTGRVYPYRRVVAVVIGINNYPHMAGGHDLNCAESGAQAVGEALRDHYGYEVVSLPGAEASKARIEETIKRYGHELGKRDALVIYFAGHGRSSNCRAAARPGI